MHEVSCQTECVTALQGVEQDAKLLLLGQECHDFGHHSVLLHQDQGVRTQLLQLDHEAGNREDVKDEDGHKLVREVCADDWPEGEIQDGRERGLLQLDSGRGETVQEQLLQVHHVALLNQVTFVEAEKKDEGNQDGDFFNILSIICRIGSRFDIFFVRFKGLI